MVPTQLDLEQLARRTGGVLLARGWRLVTAESCTGGWLGQVVTSVAGSSQWYDCGFITYSNDSKRTLLGVESSVLEQHGAVSEQVVRAMAINALQRSVGDVGVAISGVAGPSGGTAEKPVGTVWFAWATRDGVIRAAATRYAGARVDVRAHAVSLALQGVLDIAGA